MKKLLLAPEAGHNVSMPRISSKRSVRPAKTAKAEAPVMRKCLRDKLVLTGNLLLVVGGLTKKAVPQDACDTGVCGVEAPTNPTLGVVGQVLGVVDPPSAVIVP